MWQKFWKYIESLPLNDYAVYYYSHHEKTTYKKLPNGTDIISRAYPLKDGKICSSILAGHGFSAKEKLDQILDDISLVINLKGKGLIVLSGCAHAGIINTVH